MWPMKEINCACLWTWSSLAYCPWARVCNRMDLWTLSSALTSEHKAATISSSMANINLIELEYKGRIYGRSYQLNLARWSRLINFRFHARTQFSCLFLNQRRSEHDESGRIKPSNFMFLLLAAGSWPVISRIYIPEVGVSVKHLFKQLLVLARSVSWHFPCRARSILNRFQAGQFPAAMSGTSKVEFLDPLP